jgi:glycerophosphoryl diester phosphodiesterase
MKRFYILLTFALAAVISGCTPKENKIAVTAHRGFWTCDEAGYMENTVASLAQAQENGLWGSEFDIHITADDQILVNHDPVLGGKNIHEMPLDSFMTMTLKNGERPATLDDLLQISENKPNTVLVCELKPHENPEREIVLLDKTIECLKAHNLYDPDRVIFITFSLEMCKRVAELCPEFTNQFLEGAERELGPQEIHDMGINGIDYHFSKFYAHPEWVEQAHKLGMSVNVWTVDEEEDIKNMIDLGVDCITTNYPLKVRELLGDRELKLNRK